MIPMTVERIKQNLLIPVSDTRQDQDIQVTIDDQLPLIEMEIKEEVLNDPDLRVQHLLKVALGEIITGHYLKKKAEKEKDGKEMRIGPMSFVPSKTMIPERGKRGNEWIGRGYQRLKDKDYLVAEQEDYFTFGVM